MKNSNFRLYIPGPVNVSDRVQNAMNQGLVGHRSPEFTDLYTSIQPRLQKLMQTEDPVFVHTCSSWGGMEAAVVNCCRERVLNCMSGAFSDKWYSVSLACGKEAKDLRFEWGIPLDPDVIGKELSTGSYDAITIVHNETSTGTQNPISAIMDVLKAFPDVISIVDAVSSFSAIPIEKDNLGIDVLITGSQKALALPPGLCLIGISERALKRSEQIKLRGYYFDFQELYKNYLKGGTPTTPAISLFYGLKEQLNVIDEEGLDNRYARHIRLNNVVRSWVKDNDLELLPPDEFASQSLCCVKNTRNIDVVGLAKALKERYHCVMDTGYGKLKGKTFRISNMGDETDAGIAALLEHLNTLLPEFI